MEAKKRFTLELEPPVQRRLEAVAARKGVSTRRYCLVAIGKELDRDEANGASGPGFNREAFERLVAHREELFGSQPLPGDSVELLREVREMRDAEIEAGQ